MSYKTTNGLMKHLRDTGIDINGSTEKTQLTNTGYYHGYKGYRFFQNSNRRIPFTTYAEVYATIEYDSKLKSLLYGKMMYIETAVRNIALESILVNSNSETIQDMYDRVISGYKNAPAGSTDEQKKKLQQNKLKLQSSIQSNLYSAYQRKNPKITHFYNNVGYSGVPIWALFEIMNMGDLGFLLSCLTYEVRDDITRRIGFNQACDTNRQLIFKYIYTLKDLRNAIAHNDVVFDARFSRISVTNAMKQCLVLDINLPDVTFKTIGDYIILMVYYLKLLKVPKTEIKAFIREFEKITDNYRRSVSPAVAQTVINPNLSSRMNALKKFLD